MCDDKKIVNPYKRTIHKEGIPPGRQGGFLIIAAIVLVVVLAFFGLAVTFLFGGDIAAGGGHLGSAQALFIAESGVEFEQRSLAQNADWYRSTSDPTATTTNAVGQGFFSVFHNLPATELRTRMNAVATPPNQTINVFSGGPSPNGRFPNSGTLLIDDFTGAPEFVTYVGATATTFTVTARNVAVGTVPALGLNAHSRSDVVYPVTTLGVALVAGNCQAIPNPFTITENSKFLSAGTITVLHNNTATTEQITYSSSTVSGATRTLLGVQRCQNTLTPTAITASVGDPVIPIVAGIGNDDLEAEIVSTGTANGGQRTGFKTVQRQQ